MEFGTTPPYVPRRNCSVFALTARTSRPKMSRDAETYGPLRFLNTPKHAACQLSGEILTGRGVHFSAGGMLLRKQMNPRIMRRCLVSASPCHRRANLATAWDKLCGNPVGMVLLHRGHSSRTHWSRLRFQLRSVAVLVSMTDRMNALMLCDSNPSPDMAASSPDS